MPWKQQWTVPTFMHALLRCLIGLAVVVVLLGGERVGVLHDGEVYDFGIVSDAPLFQACPKRLAFSVLLASGLMQTA